MEHNMRIKIWYNVGQDKLELIYRNGSRFICNVYCTHDNYCVRNGWLYVEKLINSERHGYYELSPTFTMFAAQNDEFGLFLGPEKHGIDFANRTPWVEKLPTE